MPGWRRVEPRSLFEKQSYFLWLHILALQVRRGSWALSQRGRARVWCREVASQDPGGRCRAEAVREGLERPCTDSEAQTTFLEPRQADLNATVGFCRTFFPKKNENLQGRGAGAEVSIKEELGQAHGEAPRPSERQTHAPRLTQAMSPQQSLAIRQLSPSGKKTLRKKGLQPLHL